MGDYANGQIIVYACPVDEVEAIIAFIDDHDLGLDYNPTGDWTTELRLGLPYGGEASIGMVYNSDLSTKAPHAVYRMWVEPKYEYMGDLEIHVPELGTYRGDCDSDGDSLISRHVVAQIRAGLAPEATADELMTELAICLGEPWLDAIAALGPVEEVLVRPAAD